MAYDLNDKIYHQQDSVTHGIHLIYDLTLSPMVPSYGLPNLGNLINKEHENDLLALFVTNRTMLIQLFDAAVKMYSRRVEKLDYHFVRTIDEALDLIDAWELENRPNRQDSQDQTRPLQWLDVDAEETATQPLSWDEDWLEDDEQDANA